MHKLNSTLFYSPIFPFFEAALQLLDAPQALRALNLWLLRLSGYIRFL